MQFGETVQTARGQYMCCRCFQWIEPGEKYRRWLWKVAPRRIQVMREHLECPHDDFKDWLEDAMRDEVPEPLPLAA